MSSSLPNTTWRLSPLWITCSETPAADALNFIATEKSKKNESCLDTVANLN